MIPAKYYIFIKGVFIRDEWVVDINVQAMPYFAWGCNKHHTGIKGSFREVVSYYITDIFNQLSECNAKDKIDLLKVIKDYL